MGEETARLRQEIDRTRENLTRDVDQLADRTSPSRVVQRRVQRTRRGLSGLKDRVMGSSSGRHDERYRTGSGLGYGDLGYAPYDDDFDAAAAVGASGTGFAGRGNGGDLTSQSRSLTDTASQTASQAAESVRGSVRHAGDRAGDTVSDVRSGVREQTEGNPLAAGVIAFGIGWLVSSLLPPSEIETQAAQRAGEAAREHAGPVVEEAKQSAQEVGHNLQAQAQDAVAQVKDRAQDAAGTVREEAGSSTSA